MTIPSNTARSQLSQQIVAILSVDPANMQATGKTRQSSLVYIDLRYPVGAVHVIPCVGEQWVLKKVGMNWALAVKLPKYTNIEANVLDNPVQGLTQVGSSGVGSGPLVLDGSQVNINAPVSFNSSTLYRDNNGSLESSADGTAWVAVNADASVAQTAATTARAAAVTAQAAAETAQTTATTAQDTAGRAAAVADTSQSSANQAQVGVLALHNGLTSFLGQVPNAPNNLTVTAGPEPAADTMGAGTYLYVVSSVNDWGAEGGTTLPVQITLSGSESAVLAWQPPTPSSDPQPINTATSYNIYRYTPTTTISTRIASGVSNLTFTDDGTPTPVTAIPAALDPSTVSASAAASQTAWTTTHSTATTASSGVDTIVNSTIGAFDPTLAQEIDSFADGVTNFVNTLFGEPTVQPTLHTSVIPAGISQDKIQNLPVLQSNFDSHLNNVVSSLTGIDVSDQQTTTQAADAMSSTRDTIASLSSQIQSTNSALAGSGNGGQSFSVNFGNLPNGPFPSSFTLTSSGAGNGTLEVLNGAGHWVKCTNSEDNSILGMYESPTDTDYQQFSATISTFPGVGAINFAILRSNAAATTYVYGAVFISTSYQLTAELGCVVDGVVTVFQTLNDVPIGFNFILRAGVGANPYQFEGIVGNTTVLNYTDTAQISQIGSSYRNWGFLSKTAYNGSQVPADAPFVSCSDNSPDTIVGSTAMLTRLSTATYTPASFPAGQFIGGFIFDTVSYLSTDITALTSGTGEYTGVTVSIAGTYTISLRIGIQSVALPTGGFGSVNSAIQITTSGGVSSYLQGDPTLAFDFNGTQIYADAAAGGFVVFLNAGDSVTPGVWVTSDVTGVFVGDPNGDSMYFSIALANRSLQ